MGSQGAEARAGRRPPFLALKAKNVALCFEIADADQDGPRAGDSPTSHITHFEKKMCGGPTCPTFATPFLHLLLLMPTAVRHD